MNKSLKNFLGLYNKLKGADLIESADVHIETGVLSSFEVKGFSKSGTAKVFLHDSDEILCYTRYNREVILAQDSEFTSPRDLLESLAEEALYWYCSYQLAGYKADERWAKIWIELDLVEKIEKVEYRIK